MIDPISGWSRLWAAGISMTDTGMRAVETLNAAKEVIAARTTIMHAAMHSPLTADHAELGRMMPEKFDAFSDAGLATVAAMWRAQSAWIDHAGLLGSFALRGRPPSPADLARLGDRMMSLALGSIEATAQIGSTALAPIHRKATDNARRLTRSDSTEIEDGSTDPTWSLR